jgi:FSR family fosmidomycin resistance protein-like MFS transporter
MTTQPAEEKLALPPTSAPVNSNVEPQTDRFHTDQVATVAGGHFMHDTFSAFLPPLLNAIRESLGTSFVAAGFLVVFTWLPSLLNPFIGYLADRMSLRYFVILAPAVTATLMSAIGMANNYVALAMLLLAAGVSIAAFHAPAPAMIAQVSGDRVGKGMSFFMASGELGRTVGPVVVASAVLWWGLDGIWRLAPIGWLTSGVLYWRLHEVKANPNATPPSLRGMIPRMREVFPILIWIMAPKSMMMVALAVFLPTYMDAVQGEGLLLSAVALTILEGAGVVGALLTGTVSDRIGRGRMLFIVLVAAPILLLVFLFGPSWLLVPSLIGLGLTAISPTPVLLAIVQDQFPDNRASANGIFMFLNFIVRAAAIALLGLMADRIGLTQAFLVSGVLALGSIPAVFWLPQTTQSPSAAAH